MLYNQNGNKLKIIDNISNVWFPIISMMSNEEINIVLTHF